MDDVAIDIVELQSPAAGIESWLDPFRAMIGVPQLRGDEQVLAPKRARLECVVNSLANGDFIAIAFRTIQMSKSRFQRRPGRLLGCNEVRNQRAKPDGGDRAGP